MPRRLDSIYVGQTEAEENVSNGRQGSVRLVESVTRLEGWMTFTEAGDLLGYTKQGFHRLVFYSPNNPFDVTADVRGIGEKPIMLVREEAVRAEKGRRDRIAADQKNTDRPK